jgi:S2P endopeptidase
MISGILVLLWNIIAKWNKPEEPPVLTPVIPGVNVPNNQLVYYFLSFLIAGVFHEFGHALAATLYDIEI